MIRLWDFKNIAMPALFKQTPKIVSLEARLQLKNIKCLIVIFWAFLDFQGLNLAADMYPFTTQLASWKIDTDWVIEIKFRILENALP